MPAIFNEAAIFLVERQAIAAVSVTHRFAFVIGRFGACSYAFLLAPDFGNSVARRPLGQTDFGLSGSPSR